MIIETFSVEGTYALAKEMGEKASKGEVYSLNGELGAGKTLFSRGFAEGLGVTDTVNSPTFAIVSVYGGGRLPMYHMDVYRISDIDEMEETGYDDMFYGDGVCLIEWGDMIKEILPENTVTINIQKDMDISEDYRKIEII